MVVMDMPALNRYGETEGQTKENVDAWVDDFCYRVNFNEEAIFPDMDTAERIERLNELCADFEDKDFELLWEVHEDCDCEGCEDGDARNAEMVEEMDEFFIDGWCKTDYYRK